MKKIAVLYILLLTSCWCLFTLTRDIGEESVISYVQTHHDPWKTLSYSMPVEMSVFADIDSIPWEIKDQPTLNWFYENFNNLEISYEKGASRDGRAAFSDERSLYVLIACEDGNGFSLMVNPEGKLLISENTTISSESIEIPFGCDDWIGFDVSGIIWDCAVASTFAPLKKAREKRDWHL